jgi:hypothetical protein
MLVPVSSGRAHPWTGGEPSQISQGGERGNTQLVSVRARGLGFDIGRITPERGIYLVEVVGFRAKEKTFRLQGNFKPFTLRAQIDGREVVLDRSDLEGAGFGLADESALADAGVRLGDVTATGGPAPRKPVGAKTEPSRAARTAGTKAPAPGLKVGQLKAGRMRWSPVEMASTKPGRDVQPPAPGRTAAIQKAEVPIELKSSLFKVNTRAPLAFQAFALLDPTKEEPTVLQDPKQMLPAFENGESMTAEDYYRDLNLLEADFNAKGYSLDFRRDPEEEVLLQETAVPPGQNGVGIRFNARELTKVRSEAASFRNAVRAKETRLRALGKLTIDQLERAPGQKASVTAQRPVAGDEAITAAKAAGTTASGQGSAVPKEIAPPPIEQALAKAKGELVLRPTPYERELNPADIVKGDRGTFGISVRSNSRQAGDFKALSVVNSAGIQASIFDHDLELAAITGTTSAAATNGALTAELSVMVLGDYVSSASFRETASVPDVPLTQMAPLPTSGRDGDWSSSLDVGYGMTFMAGPIPLSVRLGARASVGCGSVLMSSPLRVENEIAPFAYADVYAQAGVNILIAEAGVRCDLNLIDARLTVHGMLQRGADEGKEFLDTEYFIHRWYAALSGDLSLYAWIYVPRFGIPPWRRKTFRTRLAGWDGYSDEKWEPALTQRKHYLFLYLNTGPVMAGYNY